MKYQQNSGDPWQILNCKIKNINGQLEMQKSQKNRNIIITLLLVILFITKIYIQDSNINKLYIIFQQYQKSIINLQNSMKKLQVNTDEKFKQDSQKMAKFQILIQKQYEEFSKNMKNITLRINERVNKLEALNLKLSESLKNLPYNHQSSNSGFNGLPQSNQNINLNSNQNLELILSVELLNYVVRQTFHENKMKFFKTLLTQPPLSVQKAKNALLLSGLNIKLKHKNALILKQLAAQVYLQNQRLQSAYKISSYKEQLPFCIVIPTRNNARNFRFQYNLQSIINQNYKNYKVVVIDDNSDDFTFELIQKFIKESGFTDKFILLQNKVVKSAVENIYIAVHQHCGEKDIVFLVDGDDELLGTKVFKTFNAVYQEKKSMVVYSNHLKINWSRDLVAYGWSQTYSANEIKKNLFRNIPQKISHLRSFNASLFRKIRDQDFKDRDGAWFMSSYDDVICLPILQMACGQITYIQQYFYLYNFGIGTNDISVDQNLQKSIATYVKEQMKKYECQITKYE